MFIYTLQRQDSLGSLTSQKSHQGVHNCKLCLCLQEFKVADVRKHEKALAEGDGADIPSIVPGVDVEAGKPASDLGYK